MIESIDPNKFGEIVKRVRSTYPDSATDRIGIVASTTFLSDKINELVEVSNKQELEIVDLKNRIRSKEL